MNKNKSGDRSLESLLKDFVKRKPIAKGYNQVDIQKYWADEMGTTINKYTQSIKLRNETVSIKINSIPLRSELQYNKDKLLKLLQQEFGYEKIQDIRIY